MTLALKDCPFCGSPGWSGAHRELPTSFIAGCSDDECIATHVAYDFVTEEAAVAAWNTRAPAWRPPEDPS